MKISVLLGILNFLLVLQLPALAQYNACNHPDPFIRNRDKCWFEQQNNLNEQIFLQNRENAIKEEQQRQLLFSGLGTVSIIAFGFVILKNKKIF